MLGIRKLALVVLAGLVLPIFGIYAGEVEGEINNLKVVPSEEAVRLEIGRVGNIKFDTFMMTNPDRLVIDCIGAKYRLAFIEQYDENSFINRVRTSQFQIDPMRITRIVVDLKKKVNYRVWEEDNVQIVEITDRAGGEMTVDVGMAEQAEPRAEAAAREEVAVPSEAVNADPPATAAASMGPVLPLVMPGVEEKTASETADRTKSDRKSSETGTRESPWIEGRAKVADSERTGDVDASADTDYLAWAEPYSRGAPAGGGGYGMGSRRITLDVQGADIKTVLRTIAEFSGVNIVAGPDVKGEVNVHIKDAPWEEALDVLLKAHGFGYREEFGMIRVAENKTLMQEELEQRTAEKKKQELLPLKTRIIFVHNSNADELRAALQNVVSSRGRIDVDVGSNSLIINDIEKNIEKINEMVKTLDQKTYQVDINAKLVEVDVEATRELGINWGLLNLHASGFSGVASASVDEGIALPSGTLKFGTVRSWGELNMILEMLEKTNKANIISNPRITTMDNREASILVGKEIPLIVADEAGNPITELTKIGIMLRVIPHVNADRTITLDLHPEVSELQSESTSQGGVIISTSEADTRVVVADGETAVIGGLIKKVTTDVKKGIPFLKDVPILGGIFSSTNTADKKQELVIFVTPTIVE
jgi:type IV pilus secretin PilQ/predicted competence protein